MKLEIKDLHVNVEGKEILKGITLTLEKGKINALMGPNGSGKSTLANTLMGHPKYEVTKGSILLDGKDITKEEPDKRAKLGLFLSFQYPHEIPGITLSNFLRSAYSSIHGDISIVEFHKMLKAKMSNLKINSEFSRRHLNTGFSGGEKKKAEILQMSILKPKYIILDETDSGLDVDALKIVAEGVNKIKNEENSFLIITHYNRILHYVVPDTVHIMYNGKIVKSGKKELALEIENSGFEIYNE